MRARSTRKPGAKRRPKRQLRSRRIQVQFKPMEHRALMDRAYTEGATVSSWVRALVLRELELPGTGY